MTKNELLEQIEQKNKELDELHMQIERLERYKEYEKSADEIRAVYDSFIYAGFGEEQAFALLNTIMSAAAKPKLF